MRRIVIALIMMSAVMAYSADRRTNFSKEEILNAIASFRSDPLSESGRLAGAIIVGYVKTSPHVFVRYTPKVLPIFGENGLSDEDRATLMAAYSAGNAGSQLREKKGDDPYAGDLQLIETYRLLRKRNSKLKVAELEKLIDLDRAGRLRQYVSSP